VNFKVKGRNWKIFACFRVPSKHVIIRILRELEQLLFFIERQYVVVFFVLSFWIMKTGIKLTDNSFARDLFSMNVKCYNIKFKIIIIK